MGEASSIEDLIQLGKHTAFVCLLLEIICVSQCGNLLFMIFGGAAPTLIGCSNLNETLTEEQACALFDVGQCEPVLEYQFRSVNVEFELLCKDAGQVKDSTSMQMVGYFIGSFIFGQVSDAYGRKWPMFGCLLINGVLGLASSFVADLHTFTILRAISSVFFTGHVVIGIVYMSEVLPSRHRLWLFFIISWSPNIVIVTALAYFCGEWRTFSLVINALPFAACLMLCFTNETCHFLVSKGKVAEAEVVVRNMYKLNGHPIDEQALARVFERERMLSQEHSGGKYFFHHLFYTWKFVGYTLTISLSYFAVSTLNYGVMFNMENMSGSLYYNTMLIGIFRFILNIVSAIADITMPKLGRKTSHLLFSGYAVCGVLVALILHVCGLAEEYHYAVRFVLLTASSVACQIYTIAGVMCNEVYPTPIRNVAFSMTQVSESLSTIVAPQVFSMTYIWVHAPYLLMVIMQAADLVCFRCFMPETKGRPMAEHMPAPEERIKLCCRPISHSKVHTEVPAKKIQV